jgi:hypothetical protein
VYSSPYPCMPYAHHNNIYHAFLRKNFVFKSSKLAIQSLARSCCATFIYITSQLKFQWCTIKKIPLKMYLKEKKMCCVLYTTENYLPRVVYNEKSLPPTNSVLVLSTLPCPWSPSWGGIHKRQFSENLETFAKRYS